MAQVFYISINALAEGTANIGVSAQVEGGAQISDSIKVTVTQAPETELELDKNELELYIGETGTVQATTNATSLELESSDPSIASVSYS